jgi:hypothetical protein
MSPQLLYVTGVTEAIEHDRGTRTGESAGNAESDAARRPRHQS